jgi:hypothetical protein
MGIGNLFLGQSLLYIALKNTECKGPMFLKGTNSNHDVQLILKHYSGK